MSHPLDNPILSALESAHARFAEGAGTARRFKPEISPLAGLRGDRAAGLQALAGLARPGERCSLFLDEATKSAPGWKVLLNLPLLQMIHTRGSFPASNLVAVELGPKDAEEMLALATLTKPGPFVLRTCELGRFVGIRDGGKLVAMAGERLRMPGLTEISAVCTHPDHLGRGYAAGLMSIVGVRIVERGEMPFLHVLPENIRAIALYERLGFEKRRSFAYVGLARA